MCEIQWTHSPGWGRGAPSFVLHMYLACSLITPAAAAITTTTTTITHDNNIIYLCMVC